MAEEVAIAIRLRNAQKFVSDANKAARSITNIKDQTGAAGRAARAMGGAYASATNTMSRGFGAAASQAKYLAVGLGAVGVAGAKMGLSFNAQIESARLRFGLFTDDVDGLTKAVQKIDMTSAFNLADLSDAAALFGNSGITDIPKVLQASANAAAASGKGVEGLKSIAIALSQISSKGRLSQEEINQLNEAGAPGAQRIIAEHFQLTAKELQNLGGQGLDAKEAIAALTAEWTSGKMARAAEAQTKTLGGQWNLLTGNVQKLSGAATESLAAGLRDTALPAVNKAVNEITRIFGQEGLSNEAKLRQARNVIVRELGPVWSDISDEISEAHIPDKLGAAVKAATPMVLDAMADIAPKAAKAFIDGWLASGPEAQVITALFLGNKLRKSDFGKALSGGKGAKGAAGSLFGGARGATPKNPVWVAVVNDAPGSGGKGKGIKETIKDVAKIGGPAALAARAAPIAGAAGAVAGLGGVLVAQYKLAQATRGNDFPSRAGGASVRDQAAGTISAPGFGNTGITRVEIPVSIDGQRVARATAVYDQVEAGRAAAVAQARK